MTIAHNCFRRLMGRLLLGFFLFTLAIFCHGRSALAQEAAISDFTVANSESHLLLYLAVSDWFTPEMEAAIHNGIPITIAFNVDLLARRNNWPDRKISEHEFNHVMEYDSLKKEYHIHLDERGGSKVSASLEEAKKLMSEINDFKVLELDELVPQASYILRAKAKLARKTMPLHFHYLIPFSSPWDFETAWYELSLRLAL